MDQPPDRFSAAAKKLNALIEDFERADVNEAVGDDSRRIKEEVITQFLREFAAERSTNDYLADELAKLAHPATWR